MKRIKIRLPESFTFSTELTVRVSDMNYGGHLSNDSLLAFLHEARLRFLEKYGYSEKDVCGYGLIMAGSAIEYKAQAFRKDVIRIDVAAEDFGQYGFTVFYRCTDSGSSAEVARAQTGMVVFDYNENRIVPVPEEFRKALTDRA